MAKKVSRNYDRLEASFLVSAPNLKHCPPPKGPEVAFAGRSNAGKSSVLNRVTGTRQMAKVSKTPGRTQLMNFFDLKTGGRLVDLPGYGYAKAGRSQQSAWQQSVNEYLSLRENLAALVLVMDIRHLNQPFDEELLDWANESQLPVRVLLNKADKIGYGAQQRALNELERAYSAHSRQSAQVFSASKGTGTDELIAAILDWTSVETWISEPRPS